MTKTAVGTPDPEDDLPPPGLTADMLAPDVTHNATITHITNAAPASQPHSRTIEVVEREFDEHGRCVKETTTRETLDLGPVPQTWRPSSPTRPATITSTYGWVHGGGGGGAAGSGR